LVIRVCSSYRNIEGNIPDTYLRILSIQHGFARIAHLLSAQLIVLAVWVMLLAILSILSLK